jgi:tetratricopeptide (TPR) repeat protein
MLALPSFSVLSITTALLLTCTAAGAQSAADLIKNGDELDLKCQPREALTFYLPAEELDPKNPHILVCIARQYRHLMSDVSSREEKLKLGKKALEYSQRAAALAPRDSDAQLSPAITYGKMLALQGRKEQVETSPRIKVAADKAIRLNPGNDLAWHVLGRWHQGVAGISPIKRSVGQLIYGKLPESTNEAAVKCFDKAIEINPARLRNYIELGCTYAQMGQTADARRYIAIGLRMPNTEHDDPELKERGRQMLGTL